VKLNLAEELAEGGWQLIEDSSIERGGCMVETPSNQIDATNGMRWKRISDALGQPSEWLDEGAA
jgi:flagellar assembly protein FliH